MNIIKKVSTNIKNTIEIQKLIVGNYDMNGFKPTIKPSELESAEMVDGVYILHRPDIVAYTGGTIACAIKLTMGSNVYSIICKDNLFDLFDEPTQKFILYHEIGHIVNKHAEKIAKEGLTVAYKYLLNRWFGDGIEMEYEADQYAVNIIGYRNVIDSLINIYKVFGIIDKTANLAEFYKRINHIK